MALIALRVIGFVGYLDYGTIFMHAMFLSVFLGGKDCFFFPPEKPKRFAGRWCLPQATGTTNSEHQVGIGKHKKNKHNVESR
jgi:hypothetical protein